MTQSYYLALLEARSLIQDSLSQSQGVGWATFPSRRPRRKSAPLLSQLPEAPIIQGSWLLPPASEPIAQWALLVSHRSTTSASHVYFQGCFWLHLAHLHNSRESLMTLTAPATLSPHPFATSSDRVPGLSCGHYSASHTVHVYLAGPWTLLLLSTLSYMAGLPLPGAPISLIQPHSTPTALQNWTATFLTTFPREPSLCSLGWGTWSHLWVSVSSLSSRTSQHLSWLLTTPLPVVFYVDNYF